jgi:uncharacterized membrane protein
MKTKPEIDSLTGQITKSSETVYEDIVISNSLFGAEAELSFDSLILPIMFLIPLLFSLLPVFSGWKKTVKLSTQILFAIWFAYNSYTIVFTVSGPLIAGWVLNIVSVAFVILCLIEFVLMKHNKLKNLRSLRSLGRAENARPF